MSCIDLPTINFLDFLRIEGSKVVISQTRISVEHEEIAHTFQTRIRYGCSLQQLELIRSKTLLYAVIVIAFLYLHPIIWVRLHQSFLHCIENEAIQKNADKRIKAIDDEINKRKQQNDDDSRQKELDSINAQLRYAQLDSVTRMELERRKQNILNEQAEIDWEREQEAKKTQIQEKADQRVAANTKAIENLSNVLEKFGNALAKMYGTQTTTQIVNNNSKSANINLVKNGMTDQQLLKKFLKVFYN